jgi:hypothetical protein
MDQSSWLQRPATRFKGGKQMSLPTNFFIGRGGAGPLYDWAAGTSIRIQSNYTSGSGYLREGMSVNKFRDRIIASNSAAFSWVNDSNFFTMEASYTGVGVWTVPYDGLWGLEAGGAGGGTSTHNSNNALGGSGAVVGGYYNLLQGEEIYLLPGQTGSGYNEQPSSLTWAAGGGGSFIWRKSEVPLGNSPTSNDYPILAAGGGGGGSDDRPVGMDASVTESGTTDRSGDVSGGTGGYSGNIQSGTPHPGSAGAGWRQNGLHAHTVCTFTSQTAYSPTFGGYGGQGGGDGPALTLYGGFGGGGGGAQRCGSAGGGGGGGYSGGAGGRASSDSAGGGGGSYRSAGTGLYASVSNPPYTNGYIEITAPV